MELKDFLLANKFIQTQSIVSDSFGDFLLQFTNNTIDVRLVSDRSIMSIDIKSSKTDKWYDVIVVIAVLYNWPGLFDKSMPFNRCNDLLQSHIKRINSIFNNKNYLKSAVRLNKYLEWRATRPIKKIQLPIIKFTVGEPWNYEGPDGQNIILGKVLKFDKSHALFKATNVQTFEEGSGRLFILFERHKGIGFLSEEDLDSVSFNAGLLDEETIDENESIENILTKPSKFVAIGSLHGT